MFRRVSYAALAWLLVAACNSPVPPASTSPGPLTAGPGSSAPATQAAGSGVVTPTGALNTPSGGPPSPSAGTGTTAPGSRPDIVVLMLDDLAEMDDRLWDRLPTIKSMFVDQSVRFDDYLGNDPLCCPGRANFLTGQTATHDGVVRNDATLLDPRETIATELQGAGYWTAIVGKYLNGTQNLTDKTPPGWSKSLIYSGGYGGQPMWLKGKEIRPPGYTTDFIASTAVKFLSGAPADKPLFMFLTPYAVHSASSSDAVAHQPNPNPKYVGDPRCSGIAPWDPPGYNEADVSDKPAWVQALAGTTYPKGWPMVRNCETMLSVDDMMKSVQAELAARGRTNVLFVLTVDNGMDFNRHRWSGKDTPYAVPMPLFFQGTGSAASMLGSVPRTENATVMNVDLAPTLCAIAGCVMGPYPNGHGADGLSILPVLEGQATSVPRQFVYVQDLGVPGRVPSWDGVRSTDSNPLGRWEYTEWVTGECELYDLKADPWELQNVCNNPTYASTQAALKAALVTLRSS